MFIREKDRLTLRQIFSSARFPFEIWAYGSRVTGGAHEGSDLDLVIRSRDLTRIPLEQMEVLTEKIRESNVPIIVELRDWARLPVSFHANISKKYEVFFSNL